MRGIRKTHEQKSAALPTMPPPNLQGAGKSIHVLIHVYQSMMTTARNSPLLMCYTQEHKKPCARNVAISQELC